MSSHRIAAVADLIIEQKIDVAQIPYSFAVGTTRDPFNMTTVGLEPTLDRLKAAGIGVVAMKVMAGGYRRSRSTKRTATFTRVRVPASRRSGGRSATIAFKPRASG